MSGDLIDECVCIRAGVSDVVLDDEELVEGILGTKVGNGRSFAGNRCDASSDSNNVMDSG